MQPNPYATPPHDKPDRADYDFERLWRRVGSVLLVLAFLPAGYALNATWRYALQPQAIEMSLDRVFLGAVLGGTLAALALICFHLGTRRGSSG